MDMPSSSLVLVAVFSLWAGALVADAKLLSIGINYGRVANNLPPPKQAIALMQSIGVGKVKIFDADPEVLSALANTGLQVTIAVTNEELPTIASSQAASDQWVQSNVAAYYPSTQINFITVGNEVLSNPDNQSLWYQLVPSMKNIYGSLARAGLAQSIKVSTSSALNVLNSSYPPSTGSFREDIATSVMQPLLRFLTQTRSYFFLNAYPYLTWSANSQDIPLAYATFAAAAEASVQDGQLQYTNLLDAQLDAVASAMAKLGYPRVRIAISETGWPTLGDENEPGANIANAAAYNQRLVSRMLAYPPLGTPLRPKTFIPTYIFALFNEDLKTGPTTERNWGLFYPTGEQVYSIDLTGRMPRDALDRPSATTASISREGLNKKNSTSGPHSSRHREGKEGSRLWCVSSPDAKPEALQQALDYACGVNPSFCESIQPNQPCFEPNTISAHAAYAFHMYWLSMQKKGGVCDFNGNAVLTSSNPSYGACEYP